MPNPTARLACLLLVVLSLAVRTLAADPGAGASATEPARHAPRSERPSAHPRRDALVVGVVESPPFAMRDESGWHGLAVELWRLTADQLGTSFRLVPYDDVYALLAAVRGGRADVGIGPVIITPELQRSMDFTIPYLHAGLAIAALPPSLGGWLLSLTRTFSPKVWMALVGLLLASLVFGTIVWLFERRRNAAHFGGGLLKGVGEGIWWATSTMTTVGYGDRIPVTPWGRAVGIVWMLASIVLISGFTALVTSTLTVHQLRPLIRSVHDLAHVQVGVVRGSNAAAYLERHHVDLVDFPDLESGLQAVATGEVVAFVGEAPSVRWLARTRFQGRLYLAPHVFDYNYLALAVPDGSAHRRAIDVAMLEVLRTSAWEDHLHHYLGLRS